MRVKYNTHNVIVTSKRLVICKLLIHKDAVYLINVMLVTVNTKTVKFYKSWYLSQLSTQLRRSPTAAVICPSP